MLRRLAIGFILFWDFGPILAASHHEQEIRIGKPELEVVAQFISHVSQIQSRLQTPVIGCGHAYHLHADMITKRENKFRNFNEGMNNLIENCPDASTLRKVLGIAHLASLESFELLNDDQLSEDIISRIAESGISNKRLKDLAKWLNESDYIGLWLCYDQSGFDQGCDMILR